MKLDEAIVMKDKNKKVILFPNVEEKLFQKAKDCIQQGNFQEAIESFLLLESLGGYTEEVYMGLTACYMEIGKYQDAKFYCKMMLDQQLGDFVEIAQMYMSILIQLNYYHEANSFLQMVKEKAPALFEIESPFYHIESFLQRVDAPSHSLHDDYEGLFSETFEQRIHHFTRIVERDEAERVELCLTFLQSNDGDDWLKTMMLQVLREQGYEQPVVVRKFQKEMTIHHIDQFDQKYVQFEQEAMKQIEESTEQQDPVLAQMMKELLRQFLFRHFPFPLEEVTYYVLAVEQITREAMFGQIEWNIPLSVNENVVQEIYRHLKEVLQLPFST